MKSILMAGEARLSRLIAGNMDLGYFGQAASNDFITYAQASSIAGVSAGSVIAANANAGWFKFAYKQKTLYVAQKPIRSNISHTNLNSAGLINGKTVTINGKQYKCRLLVGAKTFTSGSKVYHPCEFDDLLYKVCANSGLAEADRWESFTAAELGFGGSTAGSATCCTPVVALSDSTGDQCFRGRTGITVGEGGDLKAVLGSRGWRPVFELIG